MPQPKRGESQKKYIARCIPTVLHEGTTKDSKQAAAICFSMWKQHKKKSNGELLAEDMAQQLKNPNG